MAKPLHERIASARSTDRVTLTTLAELITEARAEQARQIEAHASASADSVDFALSEADRDEAASTAQRCSRNAAALASAIEELEDKLARKRESEGNRAAEAERAAALAERDELASKFREVVPVAMNELCTLLSAIKANTERMKAAQIFEADAEAVARDVPGNWSIGPSRVMRFAEMKIPEFAGAGRAWPVDEFRPVMVDYAALRAQGKAEAAALEAQREARFGYYRVTNRSGLPIFFEARHNPHASIEDLNYSGKSWEGDLAHTVAKALNAKPEVEVEAIDRPEPTPARAGSPAQGSF